MKKNCIFLLLDSITFDAINNKKISSILFPNLHYLATKFNFKKCVSNSNCTQFVLPSLFSLSMPLDEGGYDYGIKNREIAFMEILKNEGYSTLIFSNCNQMGADNGYERGATENVNSFDYRLILEQKLNRVILSKYKKNFDKKNRDDELLEDYKDLIVKIKNKIENVDILLWNKKLKKINFSIKNNIINEIQLLKKNPEIVKKRLLTINPASAWLFLGDEKLNSFKFYIKRLASAINWRFKHKISKSSLPFTLLGHKTINITDNFNKFKDKINNLKKPYFIYHHVMDLHDYENLNSISYLIKKLLNYPTWLKNTLNMHRKRKFFYDSTLMIVDTYIGKILKILDSNTILFITSDHGHRKSLKKQFKRSYITNDYFNEMHGEDIEVPFISNTNLNEKINNENHLYDTISVSKKIFSTLNINLDNYLENKNDNKKFIISEHAGRGAFNLNKDLYFTLSNFKFRMIISFINNELFVKFYDLIQDPDEINDISNDKNFENTVNEMFNYLKENRYDIIKLKLKNLKKINNNLIQV